MRAFPILAVLGVALGPGVWSTVAYVPARQYASAAVASPQQSDFRWTGRLNAGQAIEIKGVNGDVRATPASGSEIEVVARKTEGRHGDAADVTFQVVPHDGGVTICAMYPDGDRQPNECLPGGRGHMSTRDNDTRVDFTVKVPAGIAFVGRTVNGDVSTDRLDGDVAAHTVNGGITLAAAGHAEATTVNGSIHASVGRTDWTDDAGFTTVNGSITLELPTGLNLDVSLRTVNGDLESDFPMSVQGRFGRGHLSGKIGDGGRMLRLETVNGSIHLLAQH
jgi:DUF4097 and DUF4098 domain-containing protein YvlB